MRVGDEELVDPVVFLRRRSLLAAAATLLGAVFGQRLALDVAGVVERHHHVGGVIRSSVEMVPVRCIQRSSGVRPACAGRTPLDGSELFANDGRDTLGLGQDVQQVFDDRHDFLLLGHDLVLLQAREALQAHLQDFPWACVSDSRYRPSWPMPNSFPGLQGGSRRR